VAIWFEGNGEIDCTILHVEQELSEPGHLFVEVVKLMPGLSNVELMKKGDDSVTISTNEGVMTRSNITLDRDSEALALEYDEMYKAGSKITTTAHFREEFASTDAGVRHSLVMSDVEAPGVLGFLYSRFGSSKTGSAFLSATKTYLEGS
jgi:hypothetical protein